ncbi:MAG TPA: RsmD family RNA methyltransferase [Opitutales bacterium]|nr:RsmD family RNA methyltransferase [Opitutales bacterium]
MRITGGTARGINLETGRRSDVRPATDMLRQAVFSSLGEAVAGARVMDLFAGTGAYGLESLSRGAASVRFVELDRSGVAAIGRNLVAVCKSMKADPALCRVEMGDVFALRPSGEKYDLIFADPPYAMIAAKARDILRVAADNLAPAGLFVFEMPGSAGVVDARFTLVKRLGKGRNDPSACVLRLVEE